jgi:hypothetical protein
LAIRGEPVDVVAADEVMDAFTFLTWSGFV